MNTANDPSPVLTGAGGLSLHGLTVQQISKLVSGSGTDLRDALAPLLAQITDLDEQAPWGDDEIGEQFRTDVYPARTGSTQGNELQDVMTELGKELQGFAPAVTQSMQRFAEIDATAFPRNTG